MKKNLLLLLVALSATVVFADSQTAYGMPVVKLSDFVEEIDMKNMLKMPIGKILSVDLGDVSKAGATSQIEVPREYSEGANCAALRVSHVIIDTKSKVIRGAMGSNVYPTTADGFYALTNQIHAAVLEVSGGKATFYPLRFNKSKTEAWTRFYWNPDPGKKEELELYVKCFPTPKRQLCMGCLLHTVGDGIHAEMASPQTSVVGTATPVDPSVNVGIKTP